MPVHSAYAAPLSAELLRPTRWTLVESRAAAAALLASPRKHRQLIAALFSEDAELRVRAADTARRLTEKAPAQLARYADELIGFLPEIPSGESRTRWHMALVTARSAGTTAQRMRLAPILLRWTRDPSNEVRCCALEGMGLLAAREPSLRLEAVAVARECMLAGTPALRCRARDLIALANRWPEH